MAHRSSAPPPVIMVRVPWFVGATRRKVARKRSKGETSPYLGPITKTELTAHDSGVVLSNTDPEAERDPPTAPTPVSFPSQAPRSSPSSWSNDTPPPQLQPIFARVLKPSDISDAHLEALNIQVDSPCPPDELLHHAPDGTSYLPPLSPDQAITPASYADATKVDAASTKRRKDFDERLVELRIDNDTGYRVITRTTKPGNRPPRLGYMRKFWEGLESMSQYWDTGLDQYYEGPAPSADEKIEKGTKRQKLDSSQASQVTVPIFGKGHNKENDAGSESKSEEAATLDEASQTPLPENDDLLTGLENALLDLPERATSSTPEPRTCLRYKGRRTGTGRDMPDQFRTDTVKAFVEGVVWAFQCNVAAPRQMPIVQMNKLNLPVRQSAGVFRVPKERSKARSGWLEGPITCIQVRAETDFEAADLSEFQSKTKARLDVMRELGGLLQCAQERHRQGKTEVQPGQGKWWTEKKRWGGGNGGEVEAQQGNSDTKDVLQMAEEMITGRSSKTRKKKTPAMLWKELKCGSKLWDAKMDYEAVGKDPTSDFDEIFMVSALNHHISILKLTVHGAYIDYLLTEQLPNPMPSDPAWCAPRLQRTQWYDLLDIEQRVQAFCVLWGIMAYLTRDVNTTARPMEGDVDVDMPEVVGT
ncbi:hypothetical protein M409DRAFT_16050 [Zasmidium cellare ATCC 36951]|uniref:Uncharacterized protein n=1 Tax=Zasmidium cellare ATCC 36951 TaxID=1080233 RepID=A0A6A6D5T2_ZASCE|nr:uncharacterized protein M409DRAFT_16050 [Zasmidium cellare ATCC 36951]KAF2173778.1 hypothetical protein M409DRAFT_16050 [Zasmidium cellare ATCC 36951]